MGKYCRGSVFSRRYLSKWWNNDVCKYKWKVVGPGGCSCGKQNYCRKGSVRIKAALDECKQAAINAKDTAIEHNGVTGCWIHKQTATGSNYYHNVTCYSLTSSTSVWLPNDRRLGDLNKAPVCNHTSLTPSQVPSFAPSTLHPTFGPSSSTPSLPPSAALPIASPSKSLPSQYPSSLPSITKCVNHEMCNTTSYCSRQGICHQPLEDCCVAKYAPYKDLTCPESSGCSQRFRNGAPAGSPADVAFLVSVNLLLALIYAMSAYLVLRLCMKCYRAARRAEDDGSIADVELLNNHYEQMGRMHWCPGMHGEKGSMHLTMFDE